MNRRAIVEHIEGDLSRSEVEAHFKKIVDRAQGQEPVDSCSWSTVESMTVSEEIFSSPGEACNFAEAKASEREAVAVRYKAAKSGAFRDDPEISRLLALQAEAMDERLALIEKRHTARDAGYTFESSLRAFVSCDNCRSKIARHFLRETICPVCNSPLMSEGLRRKADAISDEVDAAHAKVKELSRKIHARRNEVDAESGLINWMIYGHSELLIS